MTDRNRGYKGTKVSSGGIRPLSSNSGYGNGGFFGKKRIDTNIQNNIDNTSGIWRLSGMKFTTATLETEIDNSYFEEQPSEQRWEETNRVFDSGGYKWNTGLTDAPCNLPLWPSGSKGGVTGYDRTFRDWTKIGSDEDTCDGWTFDIYGLTGYFYTFYPDPIYVEDITIVTNDYDVWDFFA